MDNIILRNGEVEAHVNSRVGLHRLIVRGEERLYQNNMDGGKWPDLERKPGALNQPDPILFPIVGSLLPASEVLKDYVFDGEFYHFGGKMFRADEPVYRTLRKAYSMPQHGFARDCELDVIEEKRESCALRLKSNNKTLKMYPYEFEYILAFDLLEDGIMKTHVVHNQNPSHHMYFSIGDHTAIKFNIEDGSNYHLQFDQESLMYFKHPMFGYTPIVCGLMPLNSETIQNYNTIELDKFQSKEVVLLKNGIPIMRYDVDAKGMYIWTADKSKFLCIEPWNGRDAALNDIVKSSNNGDLITLDKGSKPYILSRKMTFPKP